MKLLSRLFSGRPTPKRANLDPVAPDAPVWVIGDVHGRVDLLRTLMARIGDHPSTTEHTHVVTVGDYIDRGDDSADVLAQLIEWSASSPNLHCLKGNHEVMMLEFLDRPETKGARWLRNGGLQTLASFGIGGLAETSSSDALKEGSEALRAALLKKVPAGIEDWVRARPTTWASGNLHVVHAGADPKLPMEFQSEQTLLWGHPDFAKTPRDDAQWVAYGHTITDAPGPDGLGRIAVDTGAYYSGQLTAALITPDGQIQLLQT